MRRTWLESALWSSKQENKGNHNGKGEGNGNGQVTAQQDAALQLSPPAEKLSVDTPGENPMRPQVEYLPMEDIYFAAGIVNLRRGYSINKVVEMLRSEHMRGLSKEMKRAAVLMALDAAGITIAEVLTDARARQDALDAYEAGQRKQAEAEWTRRAEEIVQIQAELERVKDQYAARISRHMDAVTREKTAFSNWQTVKQQESQSMTEAADLCLRSPTGSPSRPEVNLTAVSTRTM